jgi:hypothetical protein
MARRVQVVGRTIDSNGRPVGGVGLALLHALDGGKQQRVLGASVSTSTGSFVLNASLGDGPGKGYTLQVSTNRHPIDADRLLELPAGQSIWGPHVIVVEKKPDRPTVAPANTLLLGDSDLIDLWKQDPGLFTKPLPAHDPDPCSPYTPANVPSQVFYLSEVIPIRVSGDLQIGTSAGSNRFGEFPRATLPPTLPADFFRSGSDVLRPRWGFVLELVQEWFRLGQSLGDLLYSVPLAPCEEVKLASVDWRRRDTARQTTGVDERNDQDTTVARTQSVSEVVRMLSSKSTSGSTEAGGVSASIGPASGGWSKTVSSADEAVDASTNATRDVADRTRQVSATVRTTRAFAVAEVTQQEEVNVSTRVVRNHNHCHTVTFQYFEVLDQWLVRTTPRRLRPVVLLPYAPLAFDEAQVTSHGYELRRALLDPTLAPQFDAFLAGPQQAPDAGLPPPPPPLPVDGVLTGFRIEFTDGTGFGAGVSILVAFGVNGATTRLHGAAARAADAAPGEQRFVFETTAPDGLRFSEIENVSFLLQAQSPLTPPRLTSVRIQALVGTDAREIAYLLSVDLAYGSPVRVGIDSDAVAVAKPGTSATPTEVGVPPRLLAHLQTFKYHYTAELIRSGDPGQRFRVLNALGLSEILDNAVVGQVGTLLAFPISSLDDFPRELTGELGSLEKDLAAKSEERIVTLPTPGVFAESQMGQCTACEKVDDTRFWNWQTSPCPEDAPNITPDMLASRAQSPTALLQITKSDLEAPSVQIPTLPDPMIKIGDATLAELVKNLDLQDPTAMLNMVEGLAKIGSEHSLEVFKEIWSAYTGKAGGPGTGSTTTGTSTSTTSTEGNLNPTTTV